MKYPLTLGLLFCLINTSFAEAQNINVIGLSKVEIKEAFQNFKDEKSDLEDCGNFSINSLKVQICFKNGTANYEYIDYKDPRRLEEMLTDLNFNKGILPSLNELENIQIREGLKKIGSQSRFGQVSIRGKNYKIELFSMGHANRYYSIISQE